MTRLQKLRHLTVADRLLLLQAVCMVGSVRVALSMLPFRFVQRLWRQKGTPGVATSKAQELSADKVVWAVKCVSRYVPHATCLTQALATQALLKRGHHVTRIQIGVLKTADNRLEAHAWVESGGRVLIGDTGHQRYIRIGFLA